MQHRFKKLGDFGSVSALAALHTLALEEGIIPALESAHGLAWILREVESLGGKTVVLNLSGRGDKDVEQVARFDG